MGTMLFISLEMYQFIICIRRPDFLCCNQTKRAKAYQNRPKAPPNPTGNPNFNPKNRPEVKKVRTSYFVDNFVDNVDK
jgi:hypothetical protein